MSQQGTAEKDPASRLRSTIDYRVVSVNVSEHLRLTVRFRDGLTGDVIFKKTHLRGVFGPLEDPVFFAQASCANGFVEWPGEIDLAPDAIHEEILANGTWVLD